LGLSQRSAAVARPMDLLVKRLDEGERPLPSGTQVVDVYDKMDQALLILGAPGSGKTTLLLELARDLLARATNDPAHPIPVVFPLSTWAETHKPLVVWLQDELNLRYDVPRKIAKEWVESDQVLPLLDGLDEVKAEHRGACIQAINAFRQSHGFLPLIVASRSADYGMLEQGLRLHGAVAVEQLTPEQIRTYLQDLGAVGETIRVSLDADPSLNELLETPLILNIVAVASAGRRAMPVQLSGTVTERRDHIFGLYVEQQVLRRRGAERNYRPEQMVYWLSWLGNQMVKHNQSVFYLESLQADWLPEKQGNARSLRYAMTLVLGVVGLPICSVLGFLCYEETHGAREAIFRGLFFGLFLLAIAFGNEWSGVIQPSFRAEAVHWRLPRIRDVWLTLANGPLGERRRKIQIIAFLVQGLLVGLVGWLFNGPFAGVVGALINWMFIGLIAANAAVFAEALAFVEMDRPSRPNEGTRTSARNAILVGLTTGVIGGLTVGLFAAMCFGRHWGRADAQIGLSLGLWIGLGFGLLLGLRAGGRTCIYHVVLRLWLVFNGTIPLNYVKFLDHAADRILLRKVGGAYIFLHRMLLEYFAARYVDPDLEVATPAKPSAIEHES
jgi:eukaryotic-like serine/threonine-protein kinase